MLEKYTKVYGLLNKIKPLLEKKSNFPENLELTKDFYDLVHNIGYENIINCEKIISISTTILQNLEELREQFSQSEYKLIKSTCNKTIENECNEIYTVLDLLISVDKMIKKWQTLIKDIHNPTDYECSILLSLEINPDILEIDVI